MSLANPFLRDVDAIPLHEIDASDPALHQQDTVGEYFKRLRREDPVHFCPNGRNGPYWSITKFNDIVYCDSNHQLFSSHGSILIEDIKMQGGPSGDAPVSSFIAMDQPTHDEHRKAVSPALAPGNLAKMKETVRQRAKHVLDSLPINEEFDWVGAVSVELTSLMLSTLIDAPLEDRARIIRWSDVATAEPGDGVISSWDEKSREMVACTAYFQNMYDERAKQPPKPDLISMLAHSPAMNDLSPADFLATVRLLIVGGNDTTRNSMSGSVLALHRHPGEWERLRANPVLVDSMVPEIIRWQTPIAYQGRRVLADTEVGGKMLRKGEKIAMWYLSGNRDEEVIDRADDFIIDRERPRHHLSFGFGIHRCLGNRLAELQLRILWEEIMKQNFKRIEVTGEVKRTYSNVIHGISSLPVRIHA